MLRLPPDRSDARTRCVPGAVKNHLWALFPAGIGLTFLYGQLHLVPLAVYLFLLLAYVTSAYLLIRKNGSAGWFAVPPALLFTFASYTGGPTGDAPELYVVNTVALVLCAGALIMAVGGWTAVLWDGIGRSRAFLALLLLLLGSAGFFANLISRFAVVLSGSAPAQYAVEARAWMASEYLQGLADNGNFMVLLLVWMDLLQVAYVVLTYLAMVLLTGSLHRAGRLTRRAARTLSILGATLAGLTVVGAAIATRVPVGADIAFGLTIPFMTTLLPVLLASTVSRTSTPR